MNHLCPYGRTCHLEKCPFDHSQGWSTSGEGIKCYNFDSTHNQQPHRTIEDSAILPSLHSDICKISKILDTESESQMDRMIADDEAVTNGESTTPKKQQQLRFQTYKNLLVISVAFLLQFTAFNGMGNLQSSLNTEANVGVISLSIIYAFLIFSSIFLPHPFMAIFGLKWTIIICQIA
jgi:hypothetical protein